MSIFDALYRRTAGPLLNTQLGRSGANAVCRLFRGDADCRQPVPGCIVLRDNADTSRVSAESGWQSDTEGERMVETAVLEVPVGYELDPRDEWLFDNETWTQVGRGNGQDAAYQTVLVKLISRTNTGAATNRRR